MAQTPGMLAIGWAVPVGLMLLVALALAVALAVRRRSSRARRVGIDTGMFAPIARSKPAAPSWRRFFFDVERDELPFDRATRARVYRLAAVDSQPPADPRPSDGAITEGRMLFVGSRAAAPETERRAAPPLAIGEGWCERPFLARSIVNISGMGYGSISRPAVQALSRGAAIAGCWLDTGEGGLAPYHLEGGCDLVMQIGTARYGIRDADGNFSPARARELARKVKAFEIKLAQGSRPEKGTVLPGGRVTPEIAAIRGVGDAQSAPRTRREASNTTELLDQVAGIRALTGRPVGLKTALGAGWFLNDVAENILRRGLEYAPDFVVIDGAEAGAAEPRSLLDPMALPIEEALPQAADVLLEAGLRHRIRLVASGRLVTPERAAWALCVGADFVTTARGFMFAMGCVQALRCQTNRCPTGITTHDPKLQRALVVEEKYLRVANYAMAMNRGVEAIADGCGLAHPRLLAREHCRVVRSHGTFALDKLYPYPNGGARAGVPVPAAHAAG